MDASSAHVGQDQADRAAGCQGREVRVLSPASAGSLLPAGRDLASPAALAAVLPCCRCVLNLSLGAGWELYSGSGAAIQESPPPESCTVGGGSPHRVQVPQPPCVGGSAALLSQRCLPSAAVPPRLSGAASSLQVSSGSPPPLGLSHRLSEQ